MTSSASMPPPSSLSHDSLRPAQRVRHHLTALATQIAGEQEHRLPGSHQLAEELRVSPRTVATVYKELSREGIVRTRVGDGTYLLGSRERSATQEFRVGLSVSLNAGAAGSQRWVSEICGGILDMAGAMPSSVAVVPLQHRGEADELADRTIALLPKIDGLILFPSPSASKIREAADAAGKPVVNLNAPTPTATADFVSPDYYHASFKLGVALRQAGRHRVLYLISGPIERSVSTQQRLAGLVAGLGLELGQTIGVQIAQADGPDEAAGYAAALAQLDTSAPPDAIYAAGDMLAIGTIRALQERGLRVPEDVSVIGGTGIQPAEAAHLRLTCCRQPLHELGAALLDMVVSRLLAPGKTAPGRYIALPLVGGGTTREKENRHLDLSNQP